MIKLPPRPKLPAKEVKLIKPAIVDVIKPVIIEAYKAFEPKPPKNLNFYYDTFRESSFASVETWFKTMKNNSVLLLVGSTGSGKTALIEYYSEKYSIKLDVNEEPDEDSFASTFFKGPLVLDSLETLDPSIRAILKKQLNSRRSRPLIITAEDRFADCVKTIQKLCTTVYLEKPSRQCIKNVLVQFNCPDALADEISLSANGNLGVAMHANFWTQKTKSTKGASKMFTESPLDVQKATRALLLGQRLGCIGDVTFLMHQLQNNCIQVSSLSNVSVSKAAKACDGYSLLDIMDTKKWFTTEELWSAMECVIDAGPKLLTNQQKFTYEWPKSVKKKEVLDYVYA